VKRAEFEALYSSKRMTFDLRAGFPAGDGLFYACDLCGDVIPSRPAESDGCSCGNLSIDVEWGRLGASKGDHSVSLFQVTGDRRAL
jgi:hypothetical protein